MIVVLLRLAVGCTPPPPPVEATATEAAPRLLPLAGEAAATEQEFSGLAWCGEDQLLMLPQHPDRSVFVLTRAEITAALADDLPLTPQRLPLDDGGTARDISFFDGFEAIACAPDGHLWVTVETRTTGDAAGWLVPGRLTATGVVLSPDARVALPSRSHMHNKSDEAAWIWEGRPWTLHEINAAGAATAYQLDAAGQRRSWPAPVLPFRVTDATAPDAAGRLWLINYQWEGDRALREATDPLLARWGYGPTHARTPGQRAERLVEVQVTETGGVVLVDRAPVQLVLDSQGRNWEGIARFGEGVLLLTDEHPATLLAYVPLPSP